MKIIPIDISRSGYSWAYMCKSTPAKHAKQVYRKVSDENNSDRYIAKYLISPRAKP